MAQGSALALVPVNDQAQTRFRSLSDELLYAWDRTDASVARQWSLSTAATFGTSLKRRASNLFQLARRLGVAAVEETAMAVTAYKQDRLAFHLGERAGTAVAAGANLVTRVKLATSEVSRLVQSQPREAIPQLFVLVATSIVVSGGPDGDGGAPDLDLMFGIDAHRSILSHSVLMGAALETGFLSLVQLVRLVHAKLPADHDPLWDSIAKQAEAITQAANTGASLGMSYHLLVDGLVQPAPYHDLPVSLPMEGHQAILVGNAVAEAVDAGKKPAGVAPTLTTRRAPKRPAERRRAPRPERAMQPMPVELSSHAPWWERASATEVAAAKAEHRRLRAESILVDPFVADMLADDELLIIERYGSWLEALASGTLRPLSAAQQRFVEVTMGLAPAETRHEQAWMMYRGLLEYAPKAASR